MIGRALIAAAVLLTGCSTGVTATCAAPTPAPPDQTALLPAGLSLAEVGTVTRVERADGHLSAQAVSDRRIDELTILIQDAVTAAGYRPAGMDNEGFEAEVFFTAGSYAAGQAIVRRGGCEGQWEVELVLIEPSAVPTTAPPG
ncbi:hypothetical protein [Actinokineospora sp. NPDC004072]